MLAYCINSKSHLNLFIIVKVKLLILFKHRLDRSFTKIISNFCNISITMKISRISYLPSFLAEQKMRWVILFRSLFFGLVYYCCQYYQWGMRMWFEGNQQWCRYFYCRPPSHVHHFQGTGSSYSPNQISWKFVNDDLEKIIWD